MSVSGVFCITLNVVTFIILLVCAIAMLDENSIYNDWLCTITLMISTV